MVHKESSLLLTTPLRSGICEGMFWHWYCETVIFSRKSACFLFSTSTSSFIFFIFYLFIFFYSICVIFVDITFSIMNGDKLVIGTLLDSMIMNLGKGASVEIHLVKTS